MDPTEEEESMATSLFSILIDHEGLLCGVNKLGGDGVDKKTLLKCIDLANKRATSLNHGER
jgi:exosome complex RNA-binding protein Rrp42 (RNase PH superfamily)